VHLVDEQDRAGAGQAQVTAGRVDRRADVPDAGGDRGQLGEPAPGDVADDLGQGGLAGPRRAPQQQRHGRVVVRELAERGALAGQVPLADDLFQGPRPHPHRQRSGCGGRFLPGRVEQRIPLRRLGPGHS
jgi:hypothetical protein